MDEVRFHDEVFRVGDSVRILEEPNGLEDDPTTKYAGQNGVIVRLAEGVALVKAVNKYNGQAHSYWYRLPRITTTLPIIDNTISKSISDFVESF